jgi:prevent-host-death family protein
MAYDKGMTSFNVHEAKTHFSKLLERVEHGEEIEIRRNGEPVARLVPSRAHAEEMKRRRRKAFGIWRDRGALPEGWDDPMSEDELRIWYEGPVFPPGYDPRTGEKPD